MTPPPSYKRVNAYRIRTVRIMDGQMVRGERIVHAERLSGELLLETHGPGTLVHFNATAIEEEET